MQVSVVITTRNEEQNIGRCLESIRAQTYPIDQMEIIVVDNNSTDRTKEIARRYTDHVDTYGPERSAQRNYGMIEKATGAYVIYLDADMILSECVIAECVTVLDADPNLVGLYIPEVVLGDSFWCKVRRFERSFYNGTVIDCVRTIRRDIFCDSGGFDPSLTGPEDWDLDKRIRSVGRVTLIGAHIYHNESDFNFRKYLRKKAYYGRSFSRYIKKWGTDDPDIRRQFSPWYRYVGVFIESKKWHKLLLHPLLSVGVFVLRFCVGFQYLRARTH